MFYYYFLLFLVQIFNAKCGKLGRIINGVDTCLKNDTAFVVSINFKGQHICAGAIIHKQYVLTAAHCFAATDGKETITVRYGLTKLYDDPKIYSQRINKIIVHPKYYHYHNIYDIAIIELESPFPPMPNWRPVVVYYNLPESYPLTGHVYGWGKTSQNATKYSQVLQRLTVEIYPDDMCSAENFSYLYLCVGTSNGGLCFGDDGDPLLIGDKLAGISSVLSKPCTNDTGTPELSLSFSRVDSYYEWISEYVDLEEDDYFIEYFDLL